MQTPITPFSYRIILQDISEGQGEAFEVYVPAFQAYHLGETPDQALEAYKIYFADELQRRAQEKVPMPTPDAHKKQKQIPIRMNIELYENIFSLAKQQGTSFNKFVIQTLEQVHA